MRLKSSWIISPPFDILCSWGVLIVALIVNRLSINERVLFWPQIYYMLTLVMGASHVFFTILPGRRRVASLPSAKALLIASIGVCALSMAIRYISNQIFITMLAYIALFHIFAQQYGFVVMMRKKANENYVVASADNILLLSVMIFTTFWWISPFSTLEPFYFHRGDLYFSVSENFARVSHNLFFSIFVFGLYQIIRLVVEGHAINLGKLSFIFFNIVWLYGGIVYFGDSVIFWFVLIVSHGSFYIGHILKLHIDKNLKKATIHSKARRILFIFFMCILGGGSWRVGKSTILNLMHERQVLATIVWWPLLLHYFFDSFLWRRQGFFKSALNLEIDNEYS